MAGRSQKHALEWSSTLYNGSDEEDIDTKSHNSDKYMQPPQTKKVLRVFPPGRYEDTSDDDKLEEQSVLKRPHKPPDRVFFAEDDLTSVPPPPKLKRQPNDFVYPAPPPPLFTHTTSSSLSRIPSAATLRQTSTKGSTKSYQSNGSTAWELDCVATKQPPHWMRNVSDCSAPSRPHHPVPMEFAALEIAQRQQSDEWTPAPMYGSYR